jgi:hypothetical protein
LSESETVTRRAKVYSYYCGKKVKMKKFLRGVGRRRKEDGDARTVVRISRRFFLISYIGVYC